MDQEKKLQAATELALNYQSAINAGELDKAFEMILPEERAAVTKMAFIKEKLGVDTLIESLRKYHPDIGSMKVNEATYDEKSKKYRIHLEERYPDANMLSPIFMEVWRDVFGISGEEFDEKKFKKKIKKAISRRKDMFKKGQLLDVIISNDVVEQEGKMHIAPGWLEQIAKAREKEALKEKTEPLAAEVFSAQGHEGSIFKALELYRKLIELDDSYAEKFGDIEERAAMIPKLSIEEIKTDSPSNSMQKVKVTNGGDKPIVSVNYECELYDENGEKIFSQLNQIYFMQKIEPGTSGEGYVYFDSDAGAKRKEMKVELVNVAFS